MAKVLIGNRILTIDDSLRIAASKHKVVLDTATLQKVCVDTARVHRDRAAGRDLMRQCPGSRCGAQGPSGRFHPRALHVSCTCMRARPLV